jgi:hypothetical protein
MLIGELVPTRSKCRKCCTSGVVRWFWYTWLCVTHASTKLAYINQSYKYWSSINHLPAPSITTYTRTQWHQDASTHLYRLSHPGRPPSLLYTFSILSILRRRNMHNHFSTQYYQAMNDTASGGKRQSIYSSEAHT